MRLHSHNLRSPAANLRVDIRVGKGLIDVRTENKQERRTQILIETSSTLCIYLFRNR
jgi:hypothetical protein